MRLHHVQISMPAGCEAEARRFYSGGLGLVEVPKPQDLAGRGGCWFRAPDADRVLAEIHLGVEDPFAPARKAHPALLVDSAAELEALGARLAGAGHEVSWAERHTFAGFERFHCRDPFGNRIEILASADRPSPAAGS
ncbi:VOC family protein [Brachybacterium hainanense]|uniref:VOC family protein n=1 Tax=Brachybacterium hainanense TaxID=1541174 RepID=A0ABV6R9G4_9MICO